MSKSFRKTPLWTLGNDAWSKASAARTVRRRLRQRQELAQGSLYKRMTDAYDICDFKRVVTWQEYWNRVKRDWHQRGRLHGEEMPDRKSAWLEWRKRFTRK